MVGTSNYNACFRHIASIITQKSPKTCILVYICVDSYQVGVKMAAVATGEHRGSQESAHAHTACATVGIRNYFITSYVGSKK